MSAKTIFLYFFVFLSCFAFAQFDISLGPDWNFTGVGARAAGMGGAFIGVADDATAISWNPAGLTQLDKPEASIVGRGLTDSYEMKFSGWSETHNDEHGILNFLSGVYPFKFADKQYVATLGIQRQLDLYSYFYSEDSSVSEDYTFESFSEGGASTITLGLANRLASVLSLGVAANFWIGEAFLETNDIVVKTNLDSSYYYYDKSEWTFSGFNLVAGMMLDFNYKSNPIPLRIGAVIRTPFELNIDEEFSLEEYTVNLGNPSIPYNVESNDSYTIGMPLIFGLGASYRFGDNLTLAVDMESRKFSEITLKEDYEDLTGNNEEIENLDLNQLRFGAEYLFTDIWDFAVIPMRIGGRSLPTLFNDIDEEQVVGAVFSLGTGLITDRYSIDISAENSAFEIDRMFTDTDGYIFNKSVNTLTLSCIYYF